MKQFKKTQRLQLFWSRYSFD